MKYTCCTAPTGRLASGGAQGNSYFMPMNIQAIPKTQEVLFVHKHPQLGYHLTTTEEGSLGTCETKSGFRRVFNAPEGYAFLSFDYSAEELKFVTNYAREKVWADAFNSGADLHMATAKLAFGKETKEARGDAKAVNFGIIYGQTPSGLAAKLGVSKKRGQEIYDSVLDAVPTLKKWMAYQRKEAAKRGMVFTFYGRPRNLQEYYNTSFTMIS